MSNDWVLKQLAPNEIFNHPVNQEIYGTEPINDEMLSSVKAIGVIEPIRCTKDMKILSGHRRRQHAIVAKCKLVPVLVAKFAISEPEQVQQIVHSNRPREQTMEQKARAYGKLAEAEAELARLRMLAGKKSDPRANAPQGRANDIAAEELGLKRRTAEAALATVGKIDDLTEAGKTKQADAIRETLNSGNVSKAAREAGVTPPKKDEPTPFDEPLAGIDWVLKVAVPKIQEHAILAEKALAGGRAGFSAARVSKLVKPIHELFHDIRGVVANAQQKARRK